MKKINFEIIGNILILKSKEDEHRLRKFSNDMMEKYPSLTTVVLQTSLVSGLERTRGFRHFMGVETFETTYKEHSCIFKFDITSAFFSPRLSYERQRIANLICTKETIINFFSGVGPFSIAIARKCRSCIIHSIELNKNAYNYLIENIKLNKCANQIFPYLGDAFNIVPELFVGKADRVLLPLPLEAERSLPIAFKSLKNGKGTIHWQITEKTSGEERTESIYQRINNLLNKNKIEASFKIETERLIRWIAPHVAHKAIDLVFS